ncbi:MAG: S8 family serine peptidase [Bacteroidales bacterium]|nr:S8 family serine peptidase [Bacteroidales bacterium]
MGKGVILLIATVFVLSCTSVEQDGSIVERNDPESTGSQFIPGSAEVRFTPEMTAMIEEALASGSLVTKSVSVNEVFASLGVSSLERIFPYAGEYEERTRREGLHRWYRVKFDDDIPFTKSEAAFSGLDGVEVFEPERSISVNGFFDDPMFVQQWNLRNIGIGDETFKDHCDINIVPVWKDFTTGDPSVVVAVVDGGFDFRHRDLSANYLGGYNFCNHSTAIVSNKHATHIAGIIAAVNNNSMGVSGIAGGDYALRKKGAGLLSCQVFPGDGQIGSGSGAEAIKWAADNGALIAQNSWGYNFNSEEEARAGVLAGSLKAAIDYFIEYAGCDNDGEQLPDSPMKGGLVVFSSGNESYRYNPIGEYEPVLSVGAVAADFERAYYSNYGDWVDLCAPGGDRPKGTEIFSTLPGNDYGYMQGTSMACPHVSGVAALVVSYCGGPGYTCGDLKAQLIGGANVGAVDPGLQIGPLLDALGAITFGSKAAPSKVSDFKAEGLYDGISLSWNVTTDDRGVRAYGYKVFVAKDESLLEGIDFDAPASGILSADIPVEDLNVGDTLRITFGSLDLDTRYYAMIVGYSYNGVYSEVSDIRVVSTLPNTPPVIELPDVADFNVKAHETRTFPLRIYDPEGGVVRISFTPGSPAATLDTSSLPDAVLSISGPVGGPGEYLFSITATDSYGLSTELSRKYVVSENHAPVVKKEIGSFIMNGVGEKVTFSLDDYLEDPDGEDLTFVVSSSDNSIVRGEISGNQLTFSAVKHGLVVFSVSGNDALGLGAGLVFQVYVMDPSKPVDIGPNVVTDKLVIRIGELQDARVRISGQTGKVVYDKTLKIGAFQPVSVDVGSFAPGIYKVAVTISGKTYEQRIVKV